MEVGSWNDGEDCVDGDFAADADFAAEIIMTYEMIPMMPSRRKAGQCGCTWSSMDSTTAEQRQLGINIPL